MTFKRFSELFATKYPDGEVIAHGKMGGNEGNKKTTVIFTKGGKCYDYYGAYEDVLCRVGIKTISKSRLHDLEMCLESYKKWHGKESLFGGVFDYASRIDELEKSLANIYENYIIV